MTSKEVSMRLKTAGFFEPTPKFHELRTTGEWALSSLGGLNCSKEFATKATIIPAYDAEVLFEWLRGWHRDDPFRSFGIENDGITAFDWGPRDNAKWIEYKTSLADMMAEAILWILEDNDAQTKD